MNKTSLLELAKKLNIPRRNCMKTKEELEEAIKDTITRYKEMIFNSDTPPAWRVQMNFENRCHDQTLMEDTMRKLASEGLQKNIVIDGDTMIDKRIGEVLNLDVDSTYWKDKFQTNFYSLYRP